MRLKQFLKEHIGKDIEIDVLDNSQFPKKCKLISFDSIGLSVDYGERTCPSQIFYNIMFHPFGTVFWIRGSIDISKHILEGADEE